MQLRAERELVADDFDFHYGGPRESLTNRPVCYGYSSHTDTRSIT